MLVLAGCGGTTSAPTPTPTPTPGTPPGPATGTLVVTIEGTDGNSGDVTISGPDSFRINLGSTHTLTDLLPGEYAISSQNFLTTTDRYFVGETFDTIEVKSDQEAEITVTYAELGAQSFLVVTNNDDDENRQDSLRHALNAAAIDPDIKHIVFSSEEFPEQGLPYVFDLSSALTIAEDITIIGLRGNDGAPRINLKAAGNNFLLVDVDASAEVELQNLILSDAETNFDGGAIYNSGILTLRNVTIRDNLAGRGAGIYNFDNAKLFMYGSRVMDNESSHGGGIVNLSDATLHHSQVTNNKSANDGGGILNMNAVSTLILNGSEVSGNTSATTGGGIRNMLGSVTLDGSIISDNTATKWGGGIYNAKDSPPNSIDTSLISGNEAELGAGIWNGSELEVISSVVTGNTATHSGGGIYNNIDGDLTITGSEITANKAWNTNDQDMQGGGIRSIGQLEVNTTTISGNSARLGGGLAVTAGDANIEDTIIADNVATQGGGLLSTTAGLVTVVDSTISENSAQSGGGGIAVNNGSLELTGSTVNGNTGVTNGGGVFTNAPLSIVNSTITGNTAMRGAGVMVSSGAQSEARISYSTIADNTANRTHATSTLGGAGIYVSGKLDITGTIVADNSTVGDNPVGVDIHVTSTGTATSHGYNLIGIVTDSDFTTIPTDSHSIPANLNPLADNGGPTWTMLPLSNSYAVNNGHALACQDTDGQPISVDQIGTPRPDGGHCSIGAVEVR